MITKNITSITLALSLFGCGQSSKKERELPPANKIIETKSASPDKQPEKLPETAPIVEAPKALSLDQWKQVNDPAQKETLYDVAFGDNTYVAIGNENTILTSSDSVLWEKQTIEGLDGAQQIAFGNNTFVLTSRDQTYLSPDGRSWKPATEKGPIAATSLGLFHGVFAQTYMRAFFTSPDGQTWKKSEFEDMRAGLIAYGAGQFVVADFYEDSVDSPPTLHLLISKDAASWEAVSSDVAKGLSTSFLFEQDKFILLQGDGQLLTSPDARTWSKGAKLESSKSGRVFGSLTYCKDRFIVANSLADGATVYSSPDAVTWTTHSFAFEKGVNRFACGEGALIAVGVDGSIWIAKI
jgi:hypothetical protein